MIDITSGTLGTYLSKSIFSLLDDNKMTYIPGELFDYTPNILQM